MDELNNVELQALGPGRLSHRASFPFSLWSKPVTVARRREWVADWPSSSDHVSEPKL